MRKESKSSFSKSTVAITTAACILIGVAGFRVVKDWKSSQPTSHAIPVIVSTDHYEQIHLAEAEHKIGELKRLLFIKSQAPSNLEISALQKKLDQHQDHIKGLEEALAVEKKKVDAYDTTQSTLAESIKHYNDQRQTLHKQIAEHQSEIKKTRDKLNRSKTIALRGAEQFDELHIHNVVSSYQAKLSHDELHENLASQRVLNHHLSKKLNAQKKLIRNLKFAANHAASLEDQLAIEAILASTKHEDYQQLENRLSDLSSLQNQQILDKEHINDLMGRIADLEYKLYRQNIEHDKLVDRQKKQKKILANAAALHAEMPIHRLIESQRVQSAVNESENTLALLHSKMALLTEADSQNSDLSKKISSLKSQLAQQQGLLAEAADIHEQLHIEKVLTSLHQSHQTIQDMETKLAHDETISALLAKAKEDNEQLATQYKEEQSHLQSQLDDLLSQKDLTESRLTTLQADHETYRNEQEALTKELEAKYASSLQDVEEHAGNQVLVVDLQTQLEDLKSQYASTAQSHDELSKNLESQYQETFSDLKSQLSNKDTYYNEVLQTTKIEYETSISSLQEQMAALENSLKSEHNQKLLDLQLKLARFEENERQIDELDSEHLALKDSFTANQEKLLSLESQYQETYAGLKAQLEEKDVYYQNLIQLTKNDYETTLSTLKEEATLLQSNQETDNSKKLLELQLKIAELEESEQRLLRIEEDHRSLSETLVNKEKEHEELLQQKVAELAETSSLSKTQVKQLEEALAAKETEFNSQLQQKIAELEEVLSHKENLSKEQITRLEEALAAKEAEYNTQLQQKIAELEEALTHKDNLSKEQIARLEEALATKEAEYNTQLQLKIAELEETLSHRENLSKEQIARLEEALSTKEAEYNTQLQQKIAELEESLSHKENLSKEQIARLEEALSTKEAEYNSQLQLKIAELEETLSHKDNLSKEQIARLEETLAAKEAEYNTQLQQKIAELEETLSNRENLSKEQIDRLEQTLTAKEQELTSLHTSYQDERSNTSRSNQKLLDLQLKLANLEEVERQYVQIESDLNKLQEAYASNEQQLKSFEQTHTKLSDYTELQQRTAELTEKIALLQKEIIEKNHEKDNLAETHEYQRYQELNNLRDVYDQEIHKLNSEIQALSAQVTETQNLREVERKHLLETFTSQRETLQEEISQLQLNQLSADQLTAQISDLESQLSVQKIYKDQLEAEHVKQYSYLVAEIENLQQKIEEQAAQKGTHSAEIERLNQQVDLLNLSKKLLEEENRVVIDELNAIKIEKILYSPQEESFN